MPAASPFSEAPSYVPQAWCERGGVRVAGRFADAAEEYAYAKREAVLLDRSDRGVLHVAGSDRAAWLHNLLTNAVTTLAAGDGNYAFAVNVKGRVLFDVNLLCRADAIWLDLDRAYLPAAAAHFDRYLFSEDVRIADATGEFARLACAGPGAARLAAEIGIVQLAAAPALRHGQLGEIAWVRHDAAGLPGFELYLPRGEAAAWWERLVACGARPAGSDTLDVLRIEAGIPWLGRDIDDTVLPPETGQAERGISYHKGCYLGQEVIERMRARGVLARTLAMLRMPDAEDLPVPVELRTADSAGPTDSRAHAEPRAGGQAVGRITSLARHPVEPAWIGLGYIRTGVDPSARLTAGDPPRAVSWRTD